MGDLILKNCKTIENEIVNIIIEEGKIKEMKKIKYILKYNIYLILLK